MAALRWAVDGDPALGYRLVAALTAYWWLSGRRSQAGEAASALLTKDVPGLDEEYVACVMHATPRPDDTHWTKARDIMSGLTDLRYPFVAAVWGMTTGPWGRQEQAAPLFTTDPWNSALMRLSTGLLKVLGGHPAEGETVLRDVLARFRELGERWGMAQALDWLAEVAGWRGEWAQAHEMWAEALALFERFGALEECVDVLCRRGDCLLRQGDDEAAEADFRRAGELSARAGKPDEPGVLLGLATVTGERDLLDRALAATGSDFAAAPAHCRVLTALGRHDEAIAVARSSPLAVELAAAVEGLADTMPAKRAAFLLGTAVALRGTAITGDRDVAATARRATAELGAAGFASAYAEGAAQSRTEADSTVSRLSVG